MKLAHRLVLAVATVVGVGLGLMAVLIPRSIDVEFEQFIEQQSFDAPLLDEQQEIREKLQSDYADADRRQLQSADYGLPEHRLLIVFNHGTAWLDGEPSHASYDAVTGEITLSLGGQGENQLALLGLPPIDLSGSGGPARAWFLPAEVFVQPEADFAESIRWRTYVVIVPVLLMILLLVYFLVDRAIVPVARLNAAMRGIGNGPLPKPVTPRGSEELVQLSESFNGAVERLHRLQQGRRRMTSDIAHELRTPLTNIRARLEGVAEGVFDPTVEEARLLLGELDLLTTLVDDLQQLGLAEAGDLSITLTSVDVACLISEVAETWASVAVESGVVIETSVTNELRASLDPTRSKQLLGILIDNAIRHGGEGIKVEIEAEQLDGRLRISVRDNGPGIAEEEQALVFERLYRADPSRNRGTGGAGLGLAIAQQLARLQGAELSCESVVGAGACFTLSKSL